jgi:hypothetical protein
MRNIFLLLLCLLFILNQLFYFIHVDLDFEYFLIIFRRIWRSSER